MKEVLKLALEMVQNKMYAHAEMFLKEALAQPEQEPPEALRILNHIEGTLKNGLDASEGFRILRSILAQPEQEPVSLLDASPEDHADFLQWKKDKVRAKQPKQKETEQEPVAKPTDEMLAVFKEAWKGGSIWTDRVTFALSEVFRTSKLYTTPPQPKEPEQEPVAHPFEDKAVISALSWAAGLIEQAYRECGGHNGADSWLMNYADKQGERIRQADHREWEKVNGRWQVKVTPPQRTWVGLTVEEINQAYADSYKGIPLHEGIEAKLKEKNT